MKLSKKILECDLLVSGGGPAGSRAALLALHAGFSTIILEKSKTGRSKICGGYISKRSLNILPDAFISSFQNYYPVHLVEVSCKKANYWYRSPDPLGWLVNRESFDQALLEIAVKNGATLFRGVYPSGLTFHDHEKVKYYEVKTTGSECLTIKTRYIIGADGAYGSIGRLSDLRRGKPVYRGWGLSSVENKTLQNKHKGSLTFFPIPLIGGMGWIFRSEHWINRGIGGLGKRKHLLNFFRQRFPENEQSRLPRSWPLPFFGPLQANTKGNIVLIGDAWGVVEPYSGEGIFNALRSAELAVSAINLAELKNTTLENSISPFLNSYFKIPFIKTITASILLNARSILVPSSLPTEMARLMNNDQWFTPKY